MIYLFKFILTCIRLKRAKQKCVDGECNNFVLKLSFLLFFFLFSIFNL